MTLKAIGVFIVTLAITSACLGQDICASSNDSKSSFKNIRSELVAQHLPDVCKALKTSQDTVKQLKAKLDELDKLETGLVLSESFRRASEAYFINARTLENNFTACQADLQSKCNPNLKSTMSSKDLRSLFEELKANPLLRSANPGANCYERAYLINKILAENGVKSQVAVIQSPIIMGQNPFDSSRFHKYQDHAVVTVEVAVPGKKNQTYILDTEFSDRPMRFDEYSKKATGQLCKEAAQADKSVLGLACTYKTYKSSDPFFPSSDSLHTGDILKSDLKDTCGWMLTPQVIERLQNPPEDPSLSIENLKDYLKDSYKKIREYESAPERQKFIDTIVDGI